MQDTSYLRRQVNIYIKCGVASGRENFLYFFTLFLITEFGFEEAFEEFTVENIWYSSIYLVT